MTNHGIHNPFSFSIVPVMIPVIRSFLPTTNLESFFDSNPYLILIEEFPSKSRNCFLFLRKSVCPDSALRLIWIRHPGGCPSRDLSGGWWLLSLLDRILSHKPPWISLVVFLRQQRRWYDRDIRLCLDFLVVTLTSWFLDNSSLLVYRVVDKRGYDLPFLFTVLSMTNALSIHAHPSTVLAETLHREDPFNYRDANHKPVLALTVTHSQAFWDFVTLTLSEKECLVSEQEKQYTEDECYFLLNIDIESYITFVFGHLISWIGSWFISVFTVVLMDVTFDFKKSMWVIRQRRLHNDHSTIGRAYPGATSLFYVIWSFNARMPERHTYHIRVRWILKKEYIMFYNMIASKAYRQEASSNSLFQLCPLQHMVHKFAYVKVCFGEFLYGLNTVVILFI